MRSLTGLTWLVNDHHGTAEVSIANTDLSVTRRRTLPFGNDRGTPTGAWPAIMDKGFLGGTRDNTGLVHIGAREYDPALGRFISVDPLQDLGDPQQWNGYAYGNNSPATFSDPSGLTFFEDAHGGGQIAHPKSGAGGGKNTGGGMQVSGTSLNQYRGIQLGGTGGGKTTEGRDARTLDQVALAMTNNQREFRDLDPVEQRNAQWMAFCYNSPDICRQIDKEEQQKFRQALGDVVLELTGAADAIDCADGSATGCVFLSIDILLPRLGKVRSFGRAGAVLLDAGRASDDVPWGGLCSFSGDTQVLMADGTTKPLSAIRLGDTVLATDPETGEQGPRPVTHLWIHEDTLLTLIVDGQPLDTTADHPLWNATRQQWQPAGTLTPGQHLRTPDGTTAQINGTRPTHDTTTTTYNLTIAHIHTYYVLAGNTPVLVHNTGGSCAVGLPNDPYDPAAVAERSAANRALYAPSASDRAADLGYGTRIPAQKAPFNSHGQEVFSNGKTYITRDVDGHNVTDGWKMFNRRGQRIGTYDSDLNYLKE
ncbi:polymorphic toxin-type HINT domain-containing protein [Micromonospora sp. WMMD882]|uniref:RHS repeat-associated core domain-containing protein n=1 Tax=Micromonospora sp. WMMD882 TaxID=3015151 RepID=UPI00248B88A8|nr:RHS repeat-associated core domain-containing protein [Micromonospora sp. WMMD882]WBB80432.1 polymorphic toxin-type HINT domain-containing protein [Micromonospora sp. WMMD882]